MRRARLRALIAAASAASLVLLLLLPAGVLGARADRGSDHFIEVICEGIENDEGMILFLGSAISDANGPGAGLDAYSADFEELLFTGDFELPVTGSYDDGVYSLEIPLRDDVGEPAGSATVEATLEPGGEVQAVNDRFRDGNRGFHSKGTMLPLTITSGSIALPDGSTFDMANGPCFAGEWNITFWGSNPTSFIQKFQGSNANCFLIDGDGNHVGEVFVDLFTDRTGTFAFVDAFFNDPYIEATADTEVIGGHLSTSLTFFSPESGGTEVEGSLDMTFAATGERFDYTLKGGTFSERVHGEIIDVEGSLTVQGYEPFDLGDCLLIERTGKEIQSPFRGPSESGRPPSNDLPAGARTVARGTRLSQQTKSAAVSMEEPFPCLTEVDDEGNEFPLEVVKTVWFKVAGTGAPVTLNTAGSGFDTVIAVYTLEEGSYVALPDGCVDDVPVIPFGRTLQAAVTFEADAGTTYYVQVGGFPDDLNWGSLHLRVR